MKRIIFLTILISSLALYCPGGKNNFVQKKRELNRGKEDSKEEYPPKITTIKKEEAEKKDVSKMKNENDSNRQRSIEDFLHFNKQSHITDKDSSNVEVRTDDGDKWNLSNQILPTHVDTDQKNEKKQNEKSKDEKPEADQNKAPGKIGAVLTQNTGWEKYTNYNKIKIFMLKH